MDFDKTIVPTTVLHWNYRGFTEFPLSELKRDGSDVTDIYLKENLITKLPSSISVLEQLESLYLSGNDITELPKEIAKLRCLKCLDVSGNRLRNIPDEIGDARSLKFLILDENELTELPLRIAELRSLRYLSVCDNKLEWLPQKPVYNYYHCEFRFWRNPNLKSLPYSLWYHMFRNQQTRSLNIGCLNITSAKPIGRCKIKLNHRNEIKEHVIPCPSQYQNVVDYKSNSPPSLLEICNRLFYEIIDRTVRKLNYQIDNFKYNADLPEEYANVQILDENFKEFNINSELKSPDIDENGNQFDVSRIKKNICKENKSYYVPAEVIDDYYSFVPKFLKTDLSNGPVSRCENSGCKKPIFDYVHYEFCFGKLILIDKTEDVLLSAAFCSKSCSDIWQRGKSTIQWTLA